MTVLLGLATAGLVLAIGFLIFGVLIPGWRFTFGDNRVTSNSPPLTTADEVYEVQWREYRFVLERLTERNTRKARALHTAYFLYGFAVLAAAAAVVSAMLGDF